MSGGSKTVEVKKILSHSFFLPSTHHSEFRDFHCCWNCFWHVHSSAMIVNKKVFCFIFPIYSSRVFRLAKDGRTYVKLKGRVARTINVILFCLISLCQSHDSRWSAWNGCRLLIVGFANSVVMINVTASSSAVESWVWWIENADIILLILLEFQWEHFYTFN